MLLCQTVEKFITDYEVYEKQLPDCELTEAVIGSHEKLFGSRPEVLAADKGFCPAAAKFAELAEQVDTLAIPRMQDFVDKVLRHWQAFCRDRGDYFRLETRLSADSLFLSRI